MAPVTTPRYRYREEVPDVIPVPAGELVARLPEELRGDSVEGDAGGRVIDLPCSEILQGNVPRISLGRLRELASGLIRIPEGRDPAERIALPPGWIALHFRMVTKREELLPPPSKEDAPVAVTSGETDPEPETTTVPNIESSTVSVEAEVIPPGDASATKTKASEEAGIIAIVPEESKKDPAVAKKGFFASLPIFRRSEPREKSAVPEPASVSEVVSSPPSKHPEPAGLPDKTTASPAPRELVPAAPVLERLWKLDPQDEIAEAAALQALFMTDEKLTLEKVVSRAGELPGLDACVLAHGDRVICASKAPAGTDLQTLSGQAMTMLSQIRDSSEKMGLGSVPAVTLHADRGVVSFLHRGELCLLVLHADRGFVPGVRERLQEMLGHLSEARPALPTPAST